ncbi:MAG: adenylate kinase [Armatimonadota bacterium]
METHRLILIGPPGAGKGTQSALLTARLGLIALSTGEIFRKEIDAQTDLGRLAQRYIQHGELVPNGVTIEMMSKRIREPEIRKHGFVLDGFPRTEKQAGALEELLEEIEMPITSVISLELPDEMVIERLSGRLGCTQCGEIYHSHNKPPKREGLCDKCNSNLFVRSDDTPEAISERLNIFREQTAPVIDFYENRGLLRRVNSSEAEMAYAAITR